MSRRSSACSPRQSRDVALEHFGARLSDVVNFTVFLTDLSEYAELARIRVERLGDDLPASSAVDVRGLMLGAQVEVEAIHPLGCFFGLITEGRGFESRRE